MIKVVSSTDHWREGSSDVEAGYLKVISKEDEHVRIRFFPTC